MRKWVADAIEIDINSMQGLVYTNDRINDFLRQDNALFLSANKGMGKTLLMSFKRFLSSSEHTSAVFIPRNKPYLDNMSPVHNVNRKMEEYMAKPQVVVQMWIFSFQVSILSHIKAQLGEKNIEILKQELHSTYFNYITDAELWVNPTDIFRELMQGSPNEWNKIAGASSVMEIALKQVRSEVKVFIDRVDQALLDVSQKTWITVQGALIDAAWSIFNANNHIKVYATIRQEAYANYSSPTMANITVFELSYKKRELIEILNKLALFYEGKNTFEEFIAPTTTVNMVGIEENFVEFLIRHTLHRPRDIVKICHGISSNVEKDDARSLMNTVTHIANNQVLPHIFSETMVFLDCLREEHDRKQLLALLPQNILSYDDILTVFAKVNSLDRNVIGHLELQNPKFYHPFSELYKIGLLGIVTDKNVQMFRMPTDPQDFHALSLPDSRYYILHPALKNYLEVVTNNYNVFKFIITGHNLEWREHDNEYLIGIQRALFAICDNTLKQAFYSVINKHFQYIRAHFLLPPGDDLMMLEKLVDDYINAAKDDARLQSAMDLMDILERSKLKPVASRRVDLSGFWNMSEVYEFGRTSGEAILQQDETGISGTVTLRDVMDGGVRFSVEQKVTGKMDGKKIVLEGLNFTLVEGKIEHYDLDTWTGELLDTDVIVGTSLDARGVSGNFTMKRLHPQV